MFQSESMQQFEAHLRERMKEMLKGVTAGQYDLFRRMYDPESKHAHPVDGISFAKLDWAFSQIERTVNQNAKRDRASV